MIGSRSCSNVFLSTERKRNTVLVQDIYLLHFVLYILYETHRFLASQLVVQALKKYETIYKTTRETSRLLQNQHPVTDGRWDHWWVLWYWNDHPNVQQQKTVHKWHTGILQPYMLNLFKFMSEGFFFPTSMGHKLGQKFRIPKKCQITGYIISSYTKICSILNRLLFSDVTLLIPAKVMCCQFLSTK